LKGARSFQFSTVALAQKTYTKFTERYAANLKQFNSQVNGAAEETEQVKKSTLRAYVHPYNEKHKGVGLGIANNMRVES
jgi:DNA-binding transcriptional regulator YbjK